MSHKIKFSFYNELIEVPETDEYLLYNIISGALNVLDSEVGNLMRTIQHLTSFELGDYLQYEEVLGDLFNSGYFVSAAVDETKAYENDFHAKRKRRYETSGHIGLTIGTTITCNMDCPYCFETVKPNKTLRDPKVLAGILSYVEDMIANAPVEKWSTLSITWYGGEPLINTEAIEFLSEKFIAICEKNDMEFDGSIITNGILLDEKTWQILKQSEVNSLQITIDGAKETHNIFRPLKSANHSNYEKILENVSLMPEGMDLTIRVNTDKKVAATFDEFMDDLYDHGIWPQRYKNVSLSLAHLKHYPGANVSNMDVLSEEEFFEVSQEFNRMKVKRYNAWGSQHNLNKAKLRWHTPAKESDCATWVSPYFFTFDPEGGIHKCWETFHDKSKSTGVEVFEKYNKDDFKKYLEYSRTDVHPVCQSCKFNPVCTGLSCAYDAIYEIEEEKFPCTIWKTKLDDYFKSMYLEKLENPEGIEFKVSKAAEIQTHANK